MCFNKYKYKCIWYGNKERLTLVYRKIIDWSLQANCIDILISSLLNWRKVSCAFFLIWFPSARSTYVIASVAWQSPGRVTLLIIWRFLSNCQKDTLAIIYNDGLNNDILINSGVDQVRKLVKADKKAFIVFGFDRQNGTYCVIHL